MVQPGKPFDGAGVEFSELVLGLSSAALHYLGEGTGSVPPAQKSEANLALARQNIEIIRMLKTKTNGNLSADEVRLVDGVLTDLMTKFAQVAAKV
ncbi:MAG: hypothetical protein RIQ81_1736 [Pseudomonadota bacterium]|jgi:hypothetical protein